MIINLFTSQLSKQNVTGMLSFPNMILSYYCGIIVVFAMPKLYFNDRLVTTTMRLFMIWPFILPYILPLLPALIPLSIPSHSSAQAPGSHYSTSQTLNKFLVPPIYSPLVT